LTTLRTELADQSDAEQKLNAMFAAANEAMSKSHREVIDSL
jgi:hypothetical protein